MVGILKILYGTETGNAQDLSERLWQKCQSQRICAQCSAIDYYDMQYLFRENIVVFIVSTTGQGEIPTSMRKNWHFLLSKSLPEQWLSKVKFAILGLGDSTYQKFNFAAKKLYRRLLQLGALPILDLALADEQHLLGIDEIFEKWSTDLLENKELMNMPSLTATSCLLPKFGINFDEVIECKMENSSHFFPSTIMQNERVTETNHFQDTRLISFNRSNLSYSPGDVLMVLPENLKESIEIAKDSLKLCQQYFSRKFSITLNDPSAPVPAQFIRLIDSTNPIFGDTLQYYFDLQSIPKRYFIKKMAEKSLDEMERMRLEELSSSSGIDDYLEYCVYSKRTLAEFLRDFPKTSSMLKPIDLFDIFPTIKPRPFSIASSPKAHPGEIQILVARVEYKVRRMKTPRLGLCSNFLSSCIPGQNVYISVRPGIFQDDNKHPLILIGPGTGVAPFRSIILENELSRSPRRILLFFGCRGEFRDYYFKKEWPKCKNSKIIVAFSRDQDKKIYVQDKITENGKEVCHLLNIGGITAKIYIAGSAGEMPKQVISAIKQALTIFEKIMPKEVDEYIETLEKKRKILYETWS